MKKRCKPEDLKIGMYVEIPTKWLNHPFVKNEFKITSTKQIQKFINSNIDRILIDLKKSDIDDNHSYDQILEDLAYEQRDTREAPILEKPAEKSILPSNFKEKINNNKIETKRRAEFVYSSSIQIMKNLLENPTSENIQEFKEGTAEIVKLILRNDEIAHYLLNITDYDYYTYTHSVNVGIYSILLAKSLFGNSNLHNMKRLGAGFFLHDIGKVRIDPGILHKQGELTEKEFKIIKTHTTKGYSLLLKADQLTEEGKIIVRQHHERHDGSGYPDGLAGDQIHLYSKICSIADVFDSLTSDRPYRTPISAFEALKLMKKEMLNHFEEDIFNRFVLLFKE